MGGWKEEGARFFLEVHSKRTGVNGHKLQEGKFRKENHHHSEGSKELEKVAQGGCSIFTLGEALQHLTGHGPELD